MLAIPPIKYTVSKLRHQAQLRLSRLPPSHKLRTIITTDQTRFHPPFISVPTPLTSLLPTAFPPFFHPSILSWSHPQLTSSLTQPRSDALLTAVRARATSSTVGTTSVFLYPIPHPDHFVTAFLTIQDDDIVARGFSADHNQLCSAAHAAVLGAQSLPPLLHRNTSFFLPSRSLQTPLLSLRKHTNLPSASLFLSTISVLLMTSPDIFITLLHLPTKLPKPPKSGPAPDPRIFSCNWPGPPRKDNILDGIRITVQNHAITPPPPVPTKLLAFHLWKEDNPKPIACKWAPEKSLLIPDSPIPPPFTQGALSLKQRRASSVALQVLLKHCFSGDYSCRFCPGTGDTLTCPCSFTTPHPADPAATTLANNPATSDHSTVDQAGFERRMAEYLGTTPPTPTPTPPHARRPTQHSAHHAIFSCPASHHLRLDILGTNPSPSFLFHTAKGAVQLLTFLFTSNSLLRPLPPCPDPP